MSSFSALLKRDLRLAVRQGGGAGMAIGFFLIVVSMVPLGVGPDLNLLARVAPGLLWAALLLAALLTLDRIFQADYEDGSLDAIMMGSMPLELAAAAKSLAHWITTGVPLALSAPLMGVVLNLEAKAIGPLALTMLVGTPAISFIGAIGAGLTLALRRGGLLTAVLVMPLYVPVLIFGVSAVKAAVSGPVPFEAPFLILAALSLASVVLSPLAAAAALRAALH
jgi:heme exporter protein B